SQSFILLRWMLPAAWSPRREKRAMTKCGALSKRFVAPMSRYWVNHERSFWTVRRSVRFRKPDVYARTAGQRISGSSGRSSVSLRFGVSLSSVLRPANSAVSRVPADTGMGWSEDLPEARRPESHGSPQDKQLSGAGIARRTNGQKADYRGNESQAT